MQFKLLFKISNEQKKMNFAMEITSIYNGNSGTKLRQKRV